MAQGQDKVTGHRGDDISPLDKRIIEHLQRDGRRPFTAIAADLGISEAAVRARANRLIERGLVKIVGVTDPLRLGFGQMALVGVRCVAEKAWAAAEAIAAFPEVHYLVITTGRYDMVAEVVCEDNEALLRFLTDKLGGVDGVRDSETFVYLKLMKQAFTWGTR
ncbi:MAG: Lrp/AsnC family transcriptional regulator [Chloroflexi bacterium]|jgi:Lrp/AsnC family transcriptional regulator for asnA, asnC and gidA|nr:Lrp/AsnC family transcriptional regulator [Chloroflexota bacterium]